MKNYFFHYTRRATLFGVLAVVFSPNIGIASDASQELENRHVAIKVNIPSLPSDVTLMLFSLSRNINGQNKKQPLQVKYHGHKRYTSRRPHIIEGQICPGDTLKFTLQHAKKDLTGRFVVPDFGPMPGLSLKLELLKEEAQAAPSSNYSSYKYTFTSLGHPLQAQGRDYSYIVTGKGALK